VIPAQHISFFPGYDFILFWRQTMDGPTGLAIKKFECSLECAALSCGDLTWEHVRDRAYNKLDANERLLLLSWQPTLVYRSQP
jgi:hypothetical protein